jgi:multidrug efflux system membrane fusion protein
LAYEVSEVRPQVDGIVRQRLFTEGQQVAAGQVLYQVDPAPYQAALDAARGQLAQAEAALTTACLKASRYRTLLGVDAVSRQDADDASATLQAGSGRRDVGAGRARIGAHQPGLHRASSRRSPAGSAPPP